MGIETAIGIGAGASALGGIIGGVKGKPKQTTNTSGTSQTVFDPATGREKQLQDQSYQQYLKQLQLADMQQQAAAETDPLRQAALQQQMQVLSGEAFGGPNEQELQQINQLRQAMIGQGQGDIQRFIDDNMRSTVSSAAGRGLRGQALGELQGRVLESGNEQYGNLVNQANLTAAQQAIAMPQQRLQQQSNAAAQGLTFAQQMQQQALANRQQTQNPYLLQQLMNERLQGGITSQTGNSVTPGQGGGFMGGLVGGLGGAAQGALAGAQIGSLANGGWGTAAPTNNAYAVNAQNPQAVNSFFQNNQLQRPTFGG